MNKKGMLMRDYVIILILFSAIVGIGALVVSDISSSDNGYGVNISDPNFDSTYNKIEQTTSLTDNMKESTFSSQGLGLIGTFEVMFGATRSVFQLIGGSFGLINSLFASLAVSLGIPLVIANILFGAILSIIIVIIIFIILSSLSKVKI